MPRIRYVRQARGRSHILKKTHTAARHFRWMPGSHSLHSWQPQTMEQSTEPLLSRDQDQDVELALASRRARGKVWPQRVSCTRKRMWLVTGATKTVQRQFYG